MRLRHELHWRFFGHCRFLRHRSRSRLAVLPSSDSLWCGVAVWLSVQSNHQQVVHNRPKKLLGFRTSSSRSWIAVTVPSTHSASEDPQTSTVAPTWKIELVVAFLSTGIPSRRRVLSWKGSFIQSCLLFLFKGNVRNSAPSNWIFVLLFCDYYSCRFLLLYSRFVLVFYPVDFFFTFMPALWCYLLFLYLLLLSPFLFFPSIRKLDRAHIKEHNDLQQISWCHMGEWTSFSFSTRLAAIKRQDM